MTFMSTHARPHLQTHNRAAGHSAVKGAAYRLGLKLFDRRAGAWCDFTKRKIGEAVVFAATIAPPNAPAWATDPDELWNRVELAERRKDSQVARDFRLPIPLGLTDESAKELSLELAQYICDELTVPVSLGLHRDGDLDALGKVKPPEMQGFHAHLYFPTRPILCGEAVPSGEANQESGDEARAQGFGPKLSVLSNRRTSSAVVERLLRRWAELANKHAGEAGLPADYEHRSYERAGLPDVPRPALSRAAVALERKGQATDQGDRARQVLVASQVFEKAHAAALEAQHARSVTEGPQQAEPEVFPSPFDELNATGDSPPEADGAQPHVSIFSVPPPSPAPADAQEEDPTTPLMARFTALADRPTDPEQLVLRQQVLKLVRAIERALHVIRKLVDGLEDLADRLRHQRKAKAEMDIELDGHRVRREESRQRLERWELAHPWRVRATARFGLYRGARSRTWQTLIHNLKRDQKFVQDAKAVVQLQASELEHLENEQGHLKDQEHHAQGRLSDAVGRLDALSSAAIAPLLAAVDNDAKSWIQAILPAEPADPPAAEEDPSGLKEERPKHRPRRPGPGR